MEQATQGSIVEQLCRDERQKLLVYLTRVVRSREAAKDVAQDAFMALHTAYQSGQIRRPRALLYHVATNFARTQLRHRRIEVALRHYVASEEAADEDLSPYKHALMAQLREPLATTIKKLRPHLRNAFVMAHVQGKSRAEIAAALGISERRLDKHMTKALRACRESLLSKGIASCADAKHQI